MNFNNCDSIPAYVSSVNDKNKLLLLLLFLMVTFITFCVIFYCLIVMCSRWAKHLTVNGFVIFKGL